MPRAVPARIGHGDPQHAEHERVRDVFKGNGKRVELVRQHRQGQCTQSSHGNLDAPQQREAEPTAAPDSPIHHEKRQPHHAKLMERAQRRPHGDGLARRISARNTQRKAEYSQATKNEPCNHLRFAIINGLRIDRQPRTVVSTHTSRAFGRSDYLQGMAIAHLRHGRHENGHDLRGIGRQKAHRKPANRPQSKRRKTEQHNLLHAKTSVQGSPNPRAHSAGNACNQADSSHLTQRKLTWNSQKTERRDDHEHKSNPAQT